MAFFIALILLTYSANIFTRRLTVIVLPLIALSEQLDGHHYKTNNRYQKPQCIRPRNVYIMKPAECHRHCGGNHQ